MTIIDTASPSLPCSNWSSMEMISTPHSSPLPSSKRSSMATLNTHIPHNLSPIQEGANDHISEGGADDGALNKLKDLIEHQAGHRRSDTQDTIDSIVKQYACMPPSTPCKPGDSDVTSAFEKSTVNAPYTPYTPTRIPKLRGLSRSTGSSDLRGDYEYSSSNRSSYADHHEDTPWPGSEEEVHFTPPSSPSSPTPTCPIAKGTANAEDEDITRLCKLELFETHSFSSLLTPDCFRSAPPSEYEVDSEQESEPEPRNFDSTSILLKNLDNLQDKLDNFIADYDAPLHALKTSQYVALQLPHTMEAIEADLPGDQDDEFNSIVTVAERTAEVVDGDQCAQRDQVVGAAEGNKPTGTDCKATGNFLEWVEERESADLAMQVAFGMLLGMVWVATV
jgi:hypothetical protein